MSSVESKKDIVIITGPAGLIGSAFSHAVAATGRCVILADIDRGKTLKLENELREKYGKQSAFFIKTDITRPASVESLIKETVNIYGAVHCLVNNYGRKFEDVCHDDFCENVNLHLGGYFQVCKSAAEVMKKQKFGSIVNMASIYGFTAPRFEIYEDTPMTMPVEYAAIKGGVINLTKYLASYLGPYNIRVNCISPGGVFDYQPENFVSKYCSKVPLQHRMANVDDLTGALLFLVSDESKYMTGQNLVIDGGWSL